MKIVDVRKLRRRIAIYNYFVWRGSAWRSTHDCGEPPRAD